MFVTQNELNEMRKGNFILSSDIASVSASDDENFDEYIINYKFFNLFNIKRLKVNLINPDEYYAGGDSLGFSLQSKGVIIIGGNYIISNYGIEKPFENSGLKTGDILTHINGIEVNNVNDISSTKGG